MMYRVMFLVLCLAGWPSLAAETPRPSAHDHRIRYVDYNPDEVYKLTAFYGYHIAVVFAPGENVLDTSAGYADAWEVKDHGDYITLAPKELRPETSLLVRTNRRMYSFDLRVKQPTAAPGAQAADPGQMFLVRFKYPDDERQLAELEKARGEIAARIAQQKQARRDLIASLPPKPENRAYMYQGAESIAPYEAWDDGTFTYLRFYAQQDLPVPFVVNDDGTESMANKHFDKDIMVIERTAGQFVLRKGNSVVCIYNQGAATMTPQSDTGATERGAERLIKGGQR